MKYKNSKNWNIYQKSDITLISKSVCKLLCILVVVITLTSFIYICASFYANAESENKTQTTDVTENNMKQNIDKQDTSEKNLTDKEATTKDSDKINKKDNKSNHDSKVEDETLEKNNPINNNDSDNNNVPSKAESKNAENNINNLVEQNSTEYEWDETTGTLYLNTYSGYHSWKWNILAKPEEEYKLKKIVFQESVSEIPSGLYKYPGDWKGPTPTKPYISLGNYQIETIEFQGNINIGEGDFTDIKLKDSENSSIIFDKDCTLKQGAFQRITNLRKIIFKGESTINCGNFINSPEITVIDFQKPTHILNPSFTTVEKEFTNINNSLKSIEFPDGSTFSSTESKKNNLIHGLFSYYFALETVTFHCSVNLGDGCFGVCPNLKFVNFDKDCKLGTACFSANGDFDSNVSGLIRTSSIEKINFGGPVQFSTGVFGVPNGQDETNCNLSLKSLTIPEGSDLLNAFTTSGGSDKCLALFNEYIKLEKITFKGDVHIGDNCFQRLWSLETLNFEKKCWIGNNSFLCDKGWKTIKQEYKNSLKHINFADAAEIGCCCFQGMANSASPSHYSDDLDSNNKLEELVFPEGSTLGGSAFLGFSGLKKVIFKGDVDLSAQDYFMGNAPRAYWWKNLEYLEFFGKATISKVAFYGPQKLNTLIFHGPVTIKEYTFHMDTANEPIVNNCLKEITFPKDSDLSGATCLLEAFNALEDVTFEGDVVLPNYAFQNCNSLKHVNFMGSSDIKIGCFNNCEYLESLEFGGATSFPAFGAFDMNNDDTEGGRGTKSNKCLKTLVFPEGSIIDGCQDLCKDYTALESVIFNCDVNLKGASFQYCDNLKEVQFNGSTTILDEGAFSFNDGFETLTFDVPVSIIGGNFRFCKNLTKVTFNKECIVSGEAFSGDSINPNTSLKTININLPLNIGGASFNNCTELENLNFVENTIFNDNAFCNESNVPNNKMTSLTLLNGCLIKGTGNFNTYTGLKELTCEDDSNIDVACGLYNCPNLNDIYYTKVQPPTPFSSQLYANLNKNALKIHIGCISLDAYTKQLEQDPVENGTLHNADFIDNLIPEHKLNEWSIDPEYHWHVCEICKEDIGKTEHNYPKNWEYDETHHWHKCLDCEYEPEKELHQFEGYICKICKFDYSKDIPTEVSYEENYKANSAPQTFDNIYFVIAVLGVLISIILFRKYWSTFKRK